MGDQAYKLKSVASRLLPTWVFEEKPRFRALVESFLEFIEQTHIKHGRILHRPQDLLDSLILNHDIDKTGRLVKPKDQITDEDVEYTISKFYSYHKKTYLNTFPYLNNYATTKNSYHHDFLDYNEGMPPVELSTEFSNLIKRIANFYRSKGTAPSLEFFFRAALDTHSSVSYPRDEILRVSDGEWYQPFYVRLAKYPKRTDEYVNESGEPMSEEEFLQYVHAEEPDKIETLTIPEINQLIGYQFYLIDQNYPERRETRGEVYQGSVFKNLVASKDPDKFIAWASISEKVGDFREGMELEFIQPIPFDMDLNKSIRILTRNVPEDFTQYYGAFVDDDLIDEHADSVVETHQFDPILVMLSQYAPGSVIYDKDRLFDPELEPWYYIFRSSQWIRLPNYTDPERLGIEDKAPGRWISEDGFLSSSKKLQDNYYYQDYSYEIRSRIHPHVWADFLIDAVHPSGLEVFNILMMDLIDFDAHQFKLGLDKQWHVFWDDLKEHTVDLSKQWHIFWQNIEDFHHYRDVMSKHWHLFWENTEEFQVYRDTPERSWHVTWEKQFNFHKYRDDFKKQYSIRELNNKAIRLAPDYGIAERKHRPHRSIFDFGEMPIDFYARNGSHASSLVFLGIPELRTDGQIYDLSSISNVKVCDEAIHLENNKLFIDKHLADTSKWLQNFYIEDQFTDIQEKGVGAGVRVFHLNQKTDNSYFRRRVHEADIDFKTYRLTISPEFTHHFRDHFEYDTFMDPNMNTGYMEIILDDPRKYLFFKDGRYLPPRIAPRLIARKIPITDAFIRKYRSHWIRRYSETQINEMKNGGYIEVTMVVSFDTNITPGLADVIEGYLLDDSSRILGQFDFNLNRVWSRGVDNKTNPENTLVFGRNIYDLHWNLLGYGLDYTFENNRIFVKGERLNSIDLVRVLTFGPYFNNLKRNSLHHFDFVNDSINKYYSGLTDRLETHTQLIPSHGRSNVFNRPADSQLIIRENII